MRVRSFLTLVMLVALAFTSASLLSGCGSNKTGCPINEDVSKSNVDKQGNLKNKRGKSNLFPKKMR